MSLDGSLEDFGLSDVLQLVHIGKRTGVLTIFSEEQVAEIYFKDGEAIHAIFGNEVGEKVVYQVFNWKIGQFRFEMKLVSVPETITIGSQNLILEATRRIDEWAKLRVLIPSNKSILMFAIEPRGGSENITLEPQEWRILSLVDGKRDVSEIAKHSGFSELKTTTILYGLISSGLLNVITEDEVEKAKTLDDDKEHEKSGFLSFVEKIGGAFEQEGEEQYESADNIIQQFPSKIGIVSYFINEILENVKHSDGLYNPIELPKSLNEKILELKDRYPVLAEAVIKNNSFDIKKTENNTNRLDELNTHEYLMGLSEIIDYIYDSMIVISNKSAAMRRYNNVFEKIFRDGKRIDELGLKGIIEPKIVK